MSLAAGTRLGFYEVLSLLGAGGMGEVYRARDSRLGRDVAIKVLPADVARDGTRLGRFQREAKALAAIDHPNIVTVFSVEEAAGPGHEVVHFLTMQLVEGQSLDRVIPAGGLPADRLFAIGSAIAEALTAAHDKSIVHRDLKPANVMVSADGRVKVLDFGLAKDLAASGPADATLTSAGHTQHGVVMGTPAYMSPEQVAGRSVDHRSDLFSLGILLYQMASGERPFAGASSAELASAILRDTPPLVTELRGDLPADLARLIRRCLEKDPGQRIQTARDIANECWDLSRQVAESGGIPATARRAGASGSRTPGTRPDVGFWIAVLPFKYSGSNSDLAALAEGLAEEIVTGLSRFSYLRVIAQRSTSRDAARYVMEGSLRQAGSQLRVALQLVDSVSGAHLWAETFDRPFQPDDIFTLQDQLVPRIVSTVADQHGVLVHSMSALIRSKDETELSAHEAALCVFGFHERMTPEEHQRVRAILERAVRQTPDDSDCWAMLATIYTDEHMFGFNVLPDPLGRAQVAARRAVELSPTSALASQALAQSLFFRRELDACRPVAERTIALNPMDGAISAFIGLLQALSGDWERGCAAAEAARKLNPHFPGWYWLAPSFNAYNNGEYREAIAIAKRVQIPGYFWVPAITAAAFGQLGDRAAAQAALRELLTIRPEFGATARAEFGKWFQPDLLETFLDGLRKSGLDIGRSDAPGAAPADEGFWVAVLPFKCSGGNSDLAALAEGLAEEIVTGLSRFSYLRVIARSSTSRDVARYVMEGSIRQAGSQLRVAVQLVDAVSGAHLWAETYDRPFRADDVFALQDDLVPRIVSTLADAHGILPHTMSEALRSKGPDQLSPYEAVLRSFGYGYRRTPEEHAAVRAGLERAVQQAPGYADGWAMLSLIYSEEYTFGFNLQPDPLGRTLLAARRAADAAPSSAMANNALARALFFRKEWQGFRTAADRALELNPLNGPTVAGLGSMMAYAGDWEHGCALVERAATLNPRHPGFYWFPLFYNAYRKGDYRGALSVALKINMPGFFYTHLVLAAVYGQLGERDAAGSALRELLALKPDIALHVREELGKWYPPALVAQLIEGLGKAGLDVVNETVQPATAKPSIAVLPFTNMSADANQDYFSDGLAEEIITLLARLSGLKVIARTSSFSFRGREQDVRRIAEALGVTHVLEGSVRRAGDRVRVTAQLIAAADGGHLWSERYDRELSDLFALQDDIASSITRALQITLTGASAARRYVPKVAAYEAFLKARHHQAKVTPDSWALAKTYYESAVQIDPEFGLAHVGLAFYWMAQPHFGQVSAFEAVPKARAAADAALRIDGSLPEAHAVLGNLAAQFDFDWNAAERHFAAPMAREAGYPVTRPLYGNYLFMKGDAEGAVALAERAISEDPLEVWPRMNLHAYLQAVGRDKEAFEQTQNVLELDPNLVIARVSVAHFHADWGELDRAVAAARKAYEVGPWYPDARATLAALLKRSGAEEEARALQQSLGSGGSHGDSRAQAVYHLLCGDIDAGADWTEKAIAERDFSMMYYLRFVICKPLRASHRWPAIAKMVNWPFRRPSPNRSDVNGIS